jgi:hypothetical protein
MGCVNHHSGHSRLTFIRFDFQTAVILGTVLDGRKQMLSGGINEKVGSY